ncbi:catechol 2,3-dioxygenase-like lactoylglutathione lyase family enzyme [Humitalea rosea]|uniref:Catechol 2,3-dioxygenase-like lactoylglutathione lyase family enzyme n=1 Tax=Humitalea rosea TaxID=990373 RepID=A0A2W7IJ14_9PROT|nr:VOC family protein [Humitalea rosea]PZW46870.1 catechol 2,3-dioxygenase-like lactoylglutathione lyase family enzyme [Humitalea rosea]
MRFSVDRLDHLVITCRNVEVSANWYERVLGMEREVFGPHDRLAMRFGGQKLNLRPATVTQDEWFSGDGAAPGAQDLCFIVTMQADQVAAHLRGVGVEVILGPAPKAGALGVLTSCYCRDPDGNLIEISTYGEASA